MYIIARGIRQTATLLSCLHAFYKLSLSQKKLKRKKPPPGKSTERAFTVISIYFKDNIFFGRSQILSLKQLPCPLLLKSSHQIEYGLFITNISNQFFTSGALSLLNTSKDQVVTVLTGSNISITIFRSVVLANFPRKLQTSR